MKDAAVMPAIKWPLKPVCLHHPTQLAAPPCCCAVQWGGENVFAAMMGGRSLRATAEMVYGASCMGGGELSDTYEQLYDQVGSSCMPGEWARWGREPSALAV